MTDMRDTLAGLMAMRLQLHASLSLKMAEALIGKGQPELRRHFVQTTELMLEAVDMLGGEHAEMPPTPAVTGIDVAKSPGHPGAVSYVSWHPMSEPPSTDGLPQMRRVLVTWRSIDGEISSGEMHWLQKVPLRWTELKGAEPGSTISDATGWFDRLEGDDGSVVFSPMDEQFVEHLGWAYLPVMPAGLAHG